MPILELSRPFESANLGDWTFPNGGRANIAAVSDRVKALLEKTDPDAFDFLEAQLVDLKQHSIPRYWLMDVVRLLDALEEASARVTTDFTGFQVKYKPYRGLARYKASVIQDAHIFREYFSPSEIIVDDKMKQALETLKSRRIHFTLVGEVFNG